MGRRLAAPKPIDSIEIELQPPFPFLPNQLKLIYRITSTLDGLRELGLQLAWTLNLVQNGLHMGTESEQ